MSDPIADALAAFARVRAKVSSGEPVDVRAELRSVPVVLRAMIAAAALAAADRPVNGVTMAAAGGYARGTAQTKNREHLALIAEMTPLLVGALLGRQPDAVTVAAVTEQVRQRDATIAELRRELVSVKHDREVVLGYARDLHSKARRYRDDISEERARKVRHLRPLEDG